MVRKISGKRTKSKPRGRAFTPGNNRGKPKNDVLAAPGLENSLRGTDIAPHLSEQILDPKGKEIEAFEEDDGIFLKLPHNYLNELEERAKVPVPEPKLIDSIEFTQGENKLRITLSKKHNRMFRVQIFLNDVTEVRPVTYTGSSPAMTFWKLLKGSLK